MRSLRTFIMGVIFSLALPAAQAKPNIVLIMVDDFGWESLGCYGSEQYSTPNLDQLASKGLRFENCFSTPICTTSRVMLMTGKYNFRNYTHFGYLSPDEKTFANLLQEAGYKTAIAGKWQLNGLYNKLAGHDDATRPQKAGFHESCLWQVTRQREVGERFWSPPIEKNSKFLSAEENDGLYGPDIFAEFVSDFIGRHKESPFFVYYPMVLTHSPYVPTPDTIGDQPRTQETNTIRKDRAKHYTAMISYTDKIVGSIVKRVEDLGLAENTLILFTADNGSSNRFTSTWRGIRVQGAKGYMTDPGTHVPLIAYWKGKIAAGGTLDDLIDFSDFYPTLAEVAGAKLGQEDPTDGVSFYPQLLGKPGEPREFVFCHYQPYWNFPSGQFVRSADYKLYRDGRFYQPAKDFEEKRDLTPQLENDEALRKMHRDLRQVLDAAPPAPTLKKAGRNTPEKKRLVHPDWKRLAPRKNTP